MVHSVHVDCAGAALGALIEPVAGTADLPATATAQEVGGLVRFLCCGRSGASNSKLARLDGVFLLRHAPGNEGRRLGPAAALPAVGRHLLWSEDKPEAAQRTVDLLADLVERVPVWNLGFVPTAAVLELITAPATGGGSGEHAGG